MNRFDRITAILIQLQAKRVVKGQDLAERFGVSLRTVYRDLRTLEEAGVPLYGEAGVGYSLVEGYRLPPVMFTREEATALLTAEKLAAQLTNPHMARLSRAAMDKLRAVLGHSDRDYLAELSPHVTVLQPWMHRGTTPPANDIHQLLLTGIATHRVAAIDYRAGYQGAATQRDVEPIGLYFGQYWHVVAYCRLRQEYRDFRLDRIVSLQLREEQFAPRPETLQSYWAERARQHPGTTVVVRLRPEALAYAHENKHYFGWLSEQETTEGLVEMTLQPMHLESIARWLMLFGANVTVVSPPELQRRLHNLAREAYEHFSGPPENLLT
ncbi:YafY family transcriptional regulator [Hymenobacter taeanensis]|uniref:YafY family transcriptional regulator n=1 Tax=Hymenobacter taeanensis TaxID=2735321 RepID=A0A6M6BEH3_9BACT|nr:MULTISPECIES: YafY family protein [Hymenobacter]QJX46410.1 YafY family transcriptional regulator [Hymenobacter taeanensis]UOQ80271.1 YafY family transcriptional regulator [Hymenobacter sp. 5414T-23]